MSIVTTDTISRRVCVTGGRDFANPERQSRYVHDRDLYIVCRNLQVLLHSTDTFIHGNALGADQSAAAFAEQLGCTIESYPADWNKHGRAAGPIRNKQMLDSGIDVLIAFPGNKGTANMKSICAKKGVLVIDAKTDFDVPTPKELSYEERLKRQGDTK